MSNSVNFTSHDLSTNLTASFFIKVGVVELYVLAFCFLVGVPVNSYVIWLIVSGTRIRAASDFLMLNLSVCGLSFSVNALLILLTQWFPFQSLLVLSQCFFGLSITGSPLFQCLICVERYLAVVHPVIFLKIKPLRYRVICCAVAWIITLGSCILCIIIFLLSTLHIYTWFFSVQFLLYLSVQMFCCVSVLKALKHSGPGERVREREREEENHIKRRAFSIIRVTTVSFFITYAPLTFSGFLSVVTQHSVQVLWSISYICFLLAYFVQPGLYLHRTGTFSRLCPTK